MEVVDSLSSNHATYAGLLNDRLHRARPEGARRMPSSAFEFCLTDADDRGVVPLLVAVLITKAPDHQQRAYQQVERALMLQSKAERGH